MNDMRVLPEVQASAGAASLLQQGRNCCSVAHARRASVIIDADDYFQAFAEAAERAERSILILAWDFDSRTLIVRDPASPYHQRLGDFLNALAAKRRQLRIRILDWDFPLVFGTDREFSPLYGLSWTPHRHIRFHYDGTQPLGGSHHQKIVVIDDKIAFSGGLDLTCRRWDTPQHRPGDPRRVEDGKPYPPFHDVMIAVDGDAAKELSRVARKRWTIATGEHVDELDTMTDPWPQRLQPDFTNIELGIACTWPAMDGGREVRNIEQLYLDMIARAKDYIYIENQYFTSQKIGAALAERLASPQGPEVIVVSRLLSHGWLEEMTMHVLRTRLAKELRAADRHGRFHIYCPHVEGLAENTCLDLHSKVMIVDDEWLRVGSANVSNRSMGLDTECDVVVEARGAPEVRARIRAVRDKLLAEHSGVEPEAFAAATARSSSISEAIAAVGSRERRLQELESTPSWSDAVVSAAAIADPERPVSLDSLVSQFAPIQEPKGRPMWIKLAAAAVVILALTLAWRFTPLAEYTSPQAVIGHVQAFAQSWWAPLVLMAAYTPASIVMFPRPLITLSAVIAFGPVVGFAYAMCGILLAAIAGYAAGRLMPRNTVRRIAGPRLNRVSRELRNRGLLAMTLVRLVPVAPFIVVSLVAGAIRVKSWHFALGTALGMLPGIIVATVFGQQISAGVKDPSQINGWLLTGVMLLLVGGAVAVHRWLGRSQRSAPRAPEQGS
jgi:phosphatidylserine/phosphatidylglycerophosphate/cardiolipin synthase-like enzyme/uncharacterized membrane protein YdjX (TVP38/TMEM64 family)